MRDDQDVASHELREDVRSLYRRTRQIWQEYKGLYPTWECRFSILYGPPVLSPDLLIVGSNPGFDPDYLYDAEIKTWPEDNEYTSRRWPLACKLRSTFATAGLPDLLEHSVGTNRIFFKSAGLAKNKKNGLGWGDNPLQIRRALESFCAKEVDALIVKLQPKKILVLGMAAFDLMASSLFSNTICSKGRRLFATGTLGDSDIIGIIHPTGAHISKVDWRVITAALRESLQERN